MTSTDARPTLLPGVSARTWQVVLNVSAGISAGATAITVASVFWQGGHSIGIAKFIPVVVTYALVYLCLFVWSARSKKEVAAGYTTLRRANPTLPQLDPKTGDVLRKAGEPYMGRSPKLSAISHDGRSASAARHSPPSVWAGVRSLWYLPLIALVFSLAISLHLGWLNPGGLGWVLLVFFAFVVLFGGIFLSTGLVARARLRQLRVAAPDQFVFLYTRSKDLWTGLGTLGWAMGELPSVVGIGVSADSSWLTMWRTGPARSGLAIPWPAVVSIQADSIAVGNRTLQGVLIVVRAPDGSLVALPLANAIVTPFPSASKAGVAWIVARLEALRAGRSVARLI